MGILARSWGNVFGNMRKGAYYEFGVYEGATFIASWNIYLKYEEWLNSQHVSDEPWRREYAESYNYEKPEFYAFDTFEGMPVNDEDNPAFQKGNFSFPKDKFDEKCTKIGIRYRSFKGLFSDISDQIMVKLQPAAIINIDCDLYQSTKDALEKIKGKIQQGTIMLFDDYNCFEMRNDLGQRKALTEFLETNPQFEFEPWQAYLYSGQSFFCHVKTAGLPSKS